MGARVTVRIDELGPGVRLSELTASAIGVAVLQENVFVTDVVVAGYDAQGVPQEWHVSRASVAGAAGTWIPNVELLEAVHPQAAVAAEVIHEQGTETGLPEPAAAKGDE